MVEGVDEKGKERWTVTANLQQFENGIEKLKRIHIK